MADVQNKVICWCTSCQGNPDCQQLIDTRRRHEERCGVCEMGVRLQQLLDQPLSADPLAQEQADDLAEPLFESATSSGVEEDGKSGDEPTDSASDSRLDEPEEVLPLPYDDLQSLLHDATSCTVETAILVGELGQACQRHIWPHAITFYFLEDCIIACPEPFANLHCQQVTYPAQGYCQQQKLVHV